MNLSKSDKYSRINVGDAFLVGVGSYLKAKKQDITYVNCLIEKKFTIKDTDSTYRVINHWSNLGLLDDARTIANKGWRKFSLIDLVWLRILMELREFGLSLEKVKLGYNSIHERKHIFECGVALCLFQKCINVIVFSDGHMEVVPKEAVDMEESIGCFQERSYLVISLNRCLEYILPNKNFAPKADVFQLSEKEMSLLVELRSGKYDEVSVHFENGDIDRIDTKTNLIGEIGKLADILNKVSYGDFNIRKVKDKICFVEVVKKTKV